MTDRITIDPKRGKAVIRGTNVQVRNVVNELDGGRSESEVARQFAITTEDVQAAIRYATELI